jgi:hypothetical protein
MAKIVLALAYENNIRALVNVAGFVRCIIYSQDKFIKLSACMCHGIPEDG